MIYSLAAISLIAILCAIAGVGLESLHALSRWMVPFSGGVLLGVALFWMLPEMAAEFGWLISIAWTAAGFAALLAIDRFVYPLCPACSGTHAHERCAVELHGFAAPLLAAAALHSALDGWSVAAARSSAAFGPALVIGIAFHKVPEGIALGAIARAALPSRGQAILWCAVAQSATLGGGGIEALVAPHLEARNLDVLLAIAGGTFLYLGGHAVHGELRRSGAGPAFLPALTGMAGSSVLRWFVS